MLELIPYVTAMGGVAVLCTATWMINRSTALMRCLGAVVLVWVAGYAYGALIGDYTHWQFNILTDVIAAFLILRHPAGKMQAALGGMFAVQVSAHVAYGARATWGTPDAIAYYDMLTIVAFAQLLVLGAWSIGIWGGVARDRLWHRRAKAYNKSGIIGMGKTR